MVREWATGGAEAYCIEDIADLGAIKSFTGHLPMGILGSYGARFAAIALLARCLLNEITYRINFGNEIIASFVVAKLFNYSSRDTGQWQPSHSPVQLNSDQFLHPSRFVKHTPG